MYTLRQPSLMRLEQSCLSMLNDPYKNPLSKKILDHADKYMKEEINNEKRPFHEMSYIRNWISVA